MASYTPQSVLLMVLLSPSPLLHAPHILKHVPLTDQSINSFQHCINKMINLYNWSPASHKILGVDEKRWMYNCKNCVMKWLQTGPLSIHQSYDEGHNQRTRNMSRRQSVMWNKLQWGWSRVVLSTVNGNTHTRTLSIVHRESFRLSYTQCYNVVLLEVLRARTLLCTNN